MHEDVKTSQGTREMSSQFKGTFSRCLRTQQKTYPLQVLLIQIYVCIPIWVALVLYSKKWRDMQVSQRNAARLKQVHLENTYQCRKPRKKHYHSGILTTSPNCQFPFKHSKIQTWSESEYHLYICINTHILGWKGTSDTLPRVSQPVLLLNCMFLWKKHVVCNKKSYTSLPRRFGMAHGRRAPPRHPCVALSQSWQWMEKFANRKRPTMLLPPCCGFRSHKCQMSSRNIHRVRNYFGN